MSLYHYLKPVLLPEVVCVCIEGLCTTILMQPNLSEKLVCVKIFGPKLCTRRKQSGFAVLTTILSMSPSNGVDDYITCSSLLGELMVSLACPQALPAHLMLAWQEKNLTALLSLSLSIVFFPLVFKLRFVCELCQKWMEAKVK